MRASGALARRPTERSGAPDRTGHRRFPRKRNVTRLGLHRTDESMTSGPLLLRLRGRFRGNTALPNWDSTAPTSPWPAAACCRGARTFPRKRGATRLGVPRANESMAGDSLLLQLRRRFRGIATRPRWVPPHRRVDGRRLLAAAAARTFPRKGDTTGMGSTAPTSPWPAAACCRGGEDVPRKRGDARTARSRAAASLAVRPTPASATIREMRTAAQRRSWTSARTRAQARRSNSRRCRHEARCHGRRPPKRRNVPLRRRAGARPCHPRHRAARTAGAPRRSGSAAALERAAPPHYGKAFARFPARREAR